MKIKDIVEARMSAAVKLQRAFTREQDKSSASRERAAQAKAEFEKEWKAKQEKEKQGVAEGDVIQFPKKHKSDLDSIHSCPKCSGELQGGKYAGEPVKVCIPCKQVYLSPNSKIDHNGNKKDEDAAGVGIITKQNTTVDVNKNTPKKNLRAFRL